MPSRLATLEMRTLKRKASIGSEVVVRGTEICSVSDMQLSWKASLGLSFKGHSVLWRTYVTLSPMFFESIGFNVSASLRRWYLIFLGNDA